MVEAPSSVPASSVVGLTGGIASGKSTVARMFAELGVSIVDADVVAREVVEPGTEGLRAIVEAFSSEVLTPDGTLDREKLGGIVFGDPERRQLLNAILHPLIGMRSMQLIQGALAETALCYVMYEAALLVENGSYRNFAALVVVSVAPEVQIARLRARDGLDETEARQRLDAQLALAEKVRVADYVVDNGGTRQATKEQVAAVHRELLARFSAEPEAV